MNEIYPNYKEPKLLHQFRFEVTSWVGRHFRKSKSKRIPTDSPLLLDLGVGANYAAGWTHVDFYCIRFNILKAYPHNRRPEIETDLRYPLNCPSNVVDGVYSGHTLEHFYPNHAYQLLSEIFRVLKPKC